MDLTTIFPLLSTILKTGFRIDSSSINCRRRDSSLPGAWILPPKKLHVKSAAEKSSGSGTLTSSASRLVLGQVDHKFYTLYTGLYTLTSSASRLVLGEVDYMYYTVNTGLYTLTSSASRLVLGQVEYIYIQYIKVYIHWPA